MGQRLRPDRRPIVEHRGLTSEVFLMEEEAAEIEVDGADDGQVVVDELLMTVVPAVEYFSNMST